MKYHPKSQFNGIRFPIYAGIIITLMLLCAITNPAMTIVVVLLFFGYLYGCGSCFMNYSAYLNKREIIKWLKAGNIPMLDENFQGYGIQYKYIISDKIVLVRSRSLNYIDTPQGSIYFLGSSLVEKYQDYKIQKALRIAHENR